MRHRPFWPSVGYREECYAAEDLDLWLRLGEGGRLANLPQFF